MISGTNYFQKLAEKQAKADEKKENIVIIQCNTSTEESTGGCKLASFLTNKLKEKNGKTD